MSNLLQVHNLQLHRGLDFCLRVRRLGIAPNTIVCVVGPNGSGKTTFMECLSGISQPEFGTVTIAGQNLDNLQLIRSKIGIIPDDEEWLLRDLCAAEYLSLLEDIYSKAGVNTDMQTTAKRIAAVLQFTAFRQPLGSLSHGNKKKVQIIAGLLHRPDVIVVDELRNGLDPLAIIMAERIIKEEAARGACVIAATHDLWWAERVADIVIFLHKGRVKVHGQKTVLLEQYGSLERLFTQLLSAEGKQ